MGKHLKKHDAKITTVESAALVRPKSSKVKVSVIIPCYNVEEYLEQCLGSVINQTMQELQIICVNDGSKDNTLKILKKHAQRDSRIIIIDKPNSGYGHSMNVGFKAAVGEYIGIIESDDFAEPNMFEALYKEAKEHSADVVKSNFWFYWSNPECNELHEYFAEDECGGVVKPGEYDDGSLYTRKPSIWSAIYRREFLVKNKIDFLQTPGASFQDTSFTFKVYALAERMVFVYDAFVHYRQDNENSSVNNVNKKAYCVCDEYQEIERFLDAHPQKGKELAAIKAAAFYDTCIWNYENLGIEMRYPFLKRISPWMKRIIDEVGLDNIKFRGQWWKTRDINRIANDPMEYHTWRHVERYEHQGNLLSHQSTNTPLNNLADVMEQQAKKKATPPMFSVVIPVYNVEKYLRACLESVMFQSFDDIEVICVNDGSTDRSLAVLEEYAEVDKRFVIVNQSNGGLSSARNSGISASRGKYIIFLDSDDWISENACESIKNNILKYRSADIIMFGTRPFPDTPKPSDWHIKVLTTPDTYFDHIDEKTFLTTPYMQIYVWRWCFRRQFIVDNGFSFLTTCKYGEDALFAFLTIPKSHGISVMSDKLYNYRHYRPESLMGSVTCSPDTWCREQLKILGETIKICQANGMSDSPELLAYCLDFMFGCIDKCPEPEKSTAVVELYDVLLQSSLPEHIDSLAKNYRVFWKYMCRTRRIYKKGDSMFFKIYRKLRKLAARILPPSRKVFYEHMERVMYGMQVQQRQLVEIKQLCERDKVGTAYGELCHEANTNISYTDKQYSDSKLLLQKLDKMQEEFYALRKDL